ncbi:DHH family phosphoesterase [Candidatus Woesearchaeota archaeon]|nr:DHH family phosphoesterase [Candidatus Woesearchaeota archaeon]
MSGLKKKEIEMALNHLESCKRPIFFFDDDADGLCSFLLLYRKIREGKGVIVKSRPLIDEKFIEKVENYDADKVFVLDIATMKQEFVDAVKRPVIWIDHHGPMDIDNVDYFNPRKHVKDIAYSTSNLCFDIVQQDIWIAMCGSVADWTIPHFKDAFCDKYPDLLDRNITDPAEALYNSPLGKLIRILGFNLKGTSSDAMKSVKVLTRIEEPYEILNKESPRGKFIYSNYERTDVKYQKILANAIKSVKDDKLTIYIYSEDRMSFTSDLSNELLYKYPEKMIIIAREKSGEMRMSIRSSKVIIPPILEKCLVGIEGYGGGHEHACGCSVKKEYFDEFIKRLRSEI